MKIHLSKERINKLAITLLEKILLDLSEIELERLGETIKITYAITFPDRPEDH